MTHHVRIPPADSCEDEAPFNPDDAPRSGERWSAERMARFLRMLSATHSVSAAARSVGMSRQSAYRLRSRLKGQAFDLAWDVAFHHSYDNLAHAALERALNGVEIPVFCNGEQVGSYRKYDERLTIALLQWSTPRGVPAMGRHSADAARHAGRFEALVNEIEAGEDGELPVADPGIAPPGELARLQSTELSPAQEIAYVAEFRQSRRRLGG
jgi:hypothetical protein